MRVFVAFGARRARGGQRESACSSSLSISSVPSVVLFARAGAATTAREVLGAEEEAAAAGAADVSRHAWRASRHLASVCVATQCCGHFGHLLARSSHTSARHEQCWACSARAARARVCGRGRARTAVAVLAAHLLLALVALSNECATQFSRACGKSISALAPVRPMNCSSSSSSPTSIAPSFMARDCTTASQIPSSSLSSSRPGSGSGTSALRLPSTFALGAGSPAGGFAGDGRSGDRRSMMSSFSLPPRAGAGDPGGEMRSINSGVSTIIFYGSRLRVRLTEVRGN
jgi:hypothetical protein